MLPACCCHASYDILYFTGRLLKLDSRLRGSKSVVLLQQAATEYIMYERTQWPARTLNQDIRSVFCFR